MKENQIRQWCKQNNWDKPRQLADGNWVAFPPGGLIETPLPIRFYASRFRMNRVQDRVHSVILIIAAIIVGAIAFIISPFFLAAQISRHKKNQSQP